MFSLERAIHVRIRSIVARKESTSVLLGAPDGGGPGGIFILDHLDFNVLGRWEVDRGPQELAYDFWWHLGHDVLISSEWGTPNKIENGLDPESLLSSGYGHQTASLESSAAEASTND